MAAWVFPNDRKLHGLPKLVDDDSLKNEILPKVVTAKFGDGYGIIRLTKKILHYVPEHTCTIRVCLQIKHRRTGEERPLDLLGKTYYNNEGEETDRAMRQLWKNNSNAKAPLSLAEPLGYISRYKILWQATLPGLTLLDQDLLGSNFFIVLGKSATAVARLHRSPFSPSRSVSIQDCLGNLSQTVDTITRVRPSCREILERLHSRLQDQAQRLGEQPVATLHGDLHLKNFLVHTGNVALIDLDNLCQGHPGQDIGSFIAAILYQGMLMSIPDDVIHQMLMTFYNQYQQSVGWRISDPQLNWYLAQH